MGKIDCLWKHKKRVFIGSLQMGKVSEDRSRTSYMYTIKVAQYLKGSGGSSLNYEADWSSPLTFGEQYIFFTDGDQKLDLCDFYKGFSFDWLEREDIPEHKKFVEEVVKITGQSGLP